MERGKGGDGGHLFQVLVEVFLDVPERFGRYARLVCCA